MSSSSSNTPNGLPWLAEDNSVEWQEQVMAYLQQKQLAQYVKGWACYLVPTPLTALTNAKLLVPVTVVAHAIAIIAWQTSYDNWKIKDNMAMGVIEGTLCGQYLTYVLCCPTLKAVWDAILNRLKTQNLGLAVHNTKQLLYNHLYLGGLIKDYLWHFIVMNKHLAHIGKALPNANVAHWMLENLLKDNLSWKSVVSSFYTVSPDPGLVTSFQAGVAICNHYNQLTAPPWHSNQLTAPPWHSNSAYVVPTFKNDFAACHGHPANNSKPTIL